MTSKMGILEHILEPQQGNLSTELANYLLTLDFSPSDQTRYQMLCEKAQSETLSDSEKSELEEYLSVNDFLMIMQAKARASLR